MKLNLGSGHRNLPGYTNVDLDPRADIKCDLRKLPFDDESADEIIAIHVIEHFQFWDVQDVLTEWRRVLRNGGKLILELPDLTKIIRNFVNNENPRLTILGLFGDPSHRSELMMHKWAYTYAMLEVILKQVGFNGIRQEAPQWHIPKRDMRIEACR